MTFGGASPKPSFWGSPLRANGQLTAAHAYASLITSYAEHGRAEQQNGHKSRTDVSRVLGTAANGPRAAAVQNCLGYWT